MNRTLAILADGQDPAIKRQMIRRVAALMSNARYLRESRSEHMVAVARQGWSMQRLETVFALSAFYLLVLGPLASSARGRGETMWRGVPIHYGDLIVFDDDRARKIRAVQASFSAIAARIPGGLETVSANQAADVIFRLHRALNGDGENRPMD